MQRKSRIRGLSLASFFLAVGLGGACTSSSDSTEQKDAGQQTDAPHEEAAPEDAGCQKSFGDVCAWTGCQESLADGCAQRPGMCVIMDWPSDPPVFCSTFNTADFMAVADVCGPYHGLTTNSVDQGGKRYYSATSGKLVAVVAHDYNFQTAKCLGGPADFVEPVCDNWVKLDCSDAGVEGGGAGGSAGSAGGGGLAGAGDT